MIWKLAEAGMNVARLNMSHGDYASHQRSSISCLTPWQGLKKQETKPTNLASIKTHARIKEPKQTSKI
ncbi:hypothetical protein MUK42_34836 [Musa troglodytarum]|uniref:Pyruvate kinase n=1 Tax=Musa troglodytarum TaxID=320322 RepID=A0A9E7E7U7_9LILI|nr:hypothetical protein MUK42_34836 [Musa troglodytarum]